MVSFNRKIVSILEQSGRIDQAVLQSASRVSASGGTSVTSYLVEENVVDSEELLGILSDRLNVPPVNLEHISIPEDATKIVPGSLARETGCIPMFKVGDVLTVAVSNPFDVVRHDDLRLATGCSLRLALALDSQILSKFDELYGEQDDGLSDLLDQMDPDVELEEGDGEDDEMFDIAKSAEDGKAAPVIKLVNHIIYAAIKQKASDIHIEPMEKRIRVRYRMDGALVEELEPPKRMQKAIVSRIKIMSDLDIAERRKPQDGKFQVKAEGRQVDFRVSTLPTVYGEKVVMRILDASNLALSLETLGFEEKALGDFRDAIASPYGMILVTGPTGSGKTTTLYSAVKEIMTPEKNFVTVEDPVEYTLDGINQVQVKIKSGLTFSAALRSILRQDPDTVMIGEIRDTETINIAIKAALTGHLVLSTLHTNDAAGTITRMIDMGVDPFMVASATLLVSAQRLLRKLCNYCREEYEVNPDRLLQVGFTQAEVNEGVTLFKPVGCSRCSRGYSGRFAILETLPLTDTIKRMVINGHSAIEIRNSAVEEGMISLRRSALNNAKAGKTSIEEVLRVTLSDDRAKPKSAPDEETTEQV